MHCYNLNTTELTFDDELDLSFLSADLEATQDKRADKLNTATASTGTNSLTLPELSSCSTSTSHFTKLNTGSHRSHQSLSDPASPMQSNEGSPGAKNHERGELSGHQRRENKDDPIQRLSDLSTKLSGLLSQIDAGPPNITLQDLIIPEDDTTPAKATKVDFILNGTRQFLDIIDLYSTSSRNSTLSPPKTTSSAGSSVVNSPDCAPISPPSIASTPRDNSVQQPEANIHLDNAALLLILTCYVHILRLYVVVFAHVHIFLVEIASSNDRFICPIPNLSFNQFPIRKSLLVTIVHDDELLPKIPFFHHSIDATAHLSSWSFTHFE